MLRSWGGSCKEQGGKAKYGVDCAMCGGGGGCKALGRVAWIVGLESGDGGFNGFGRGGVEGCKAWPWDL